MRDKKKVSEPSGYSYFLRSGSGEKEKNKGGLWKVPSPRGEMNLNALEDDGDGS